MAFPESPIPQALVQSVMQNLPSIERRLREQTAATLVAAIVSAAGRPFSIEEILEIQRDISFSLYADGGSGNYQDWTKTKDTRLKKVWS